MAPLVIFFSLGAACVDGDDAAVEPLLDVAGGFFDAPFPVPYRLRADGTIDVADFPNPRRVDVVDQYVADVDRRSEGFGRNTGIWFPFSGPLDPASLPASPVMDPSLDDSVYLVNVDEGSPRYGALVPIEVEVKPEAETYSPPNLLVIIPRQGHVLDAETWYAAVVTRGVRAADGSPVGTPRLVRDARSGRDGAGARAPALATELERLFELLTDQGRDADEVAVATVYRTGAPTRSMRRIAEAISARPPPTARALTQIRDHDLFTVYEGELDMPLFQVGERPYDTDGYIELDADGAPIEQGVESVRFSLSIPKQPVPEQGFPLTVYAPGQGGSYLQVVDRGPDDTLDDGDGPARYLAHRGIASLGIEMSLTGPRHPTGSTTGLPFFNITNAVALRDNHRQAVAEQGVLAALARTLVVPGADPDGVDVTFDPERIFIYGHSTGSLVTAIAAGVFDDFRAVLLSGSGGSWLYNLSIKESPDVVTIATLVLGLRDGDLPDRHDPIINLVATLLEPVEPMSYAATWSTGPEPPSVLLLSGLIDTYFLPEMISALAVAGGMDVAEPVVSQEILEELEAVGRGALPTPLSGNAADGEATIATTQYEQLPGRDGHYVTFQLEAARHQYSCFLATAASGLATVVPPREDGLAPCE